MIFMFMLNVDFPVHYLDLVELKLNHQELKRKLLERLFLLSHFQIVMMNAQYAKLRMLYCNSKRELVLCIAD